MAEPKKTTKMQDKSKIGRAISGDYPPNYMPDTFDKAVQAVTNIFRNPYQGAIDATLYLADRAGVPTNAMNWARDLNVSIPYRISSAARGLFNTILKGGSFKDNYNESLANPTRIDDYFMIRPLPNDNGNYSNEELNVMRRMVKKDGSIDSSSIKKVSSDGRYGAFGGLSSYFTPDKVVQSSIGQTPPNRGYVGYINDTFDFNTKRPKDKRDNAKYLEEAKRNPGLNYQTVRAIAPYINSTDRMPDEFKIKTRMNLNE